MKQIQYSFALANGLPIHIDEVTEEHRANNMYACMCCNKKMAAHIKGKREKHFQHVEYVEHDKETYLHIAAKAIFQQSYQKALDNNTPVYIEYYRNEFCNEHFDLTKNTCDLGLVRYKFDLTRVFNEIQVEKRIDGLIPDLCLKSPKGDIIFIEIHVTHKCDDNKIKSGNRIIEFKIQSEADLNSLHSLDISMKNDNVTLHNIRGSDVSVKCTERKRGCRILFDYLTVFLNGEYIIGCDPLEYIIGDITNAKYYALEKHYSLSLEHDTTNDYYKHKDFLTNALKNNITLKNCILCKYHLRNKRNRGGLIYCKLKGKCLDATHAKSCNDFRVIAM